jgi:hypothetical protein
MIAIVKGIVDLLPFVDGHGANNNGRGHARQQHHSHGAAHGDTDDRARAQHRTSARGSCEEEDSASAHGTRWAQ